MIDPDLPPPPNLPPPSRRSSFFREEATEDSRDIPPRSHPSMRAMQGGRERMASGYYEEEDDEYDDEEEYDRRGRSSRLSLIQNILNSNGSSTRHLVYAAAGIGALLVLFIGGWMVSHSSNQDIPIFDQPKQPAKEKPVQDNTMNTIGMDQGNRVDMNGKPVLAPAPEQANPSALAAQLNVTPPAKTEAQTDQGAVAPPPVFIPRPVAGNANIQAGNTVTGNTVNNQPNSQPNIQANAQTVPNASTATQTSQDTLDTVDSANPEDNATSEQEEAPAKKTVVKKQDEQNEQKHKVVSKKVAVESKTEEQPKVAHGYVMIQLAALGSNSAAQKQWQNMRKKAPSLLGKYSPVIQKVEVRGHEIYRIRIKGFASTGQAGHFCGELREKGLSCTLANF